MFANWIWESERNSGVKLELRTANNNSYINNNFKKLLFLSPREIKVVVRRLKAQQQNNKKKKRKKKKATKKKKKKKRNSRLSNHITSSSQEVQIIVGLETPPLMFVCGVNSRHRNQVKGASLYDWWIPRHRSLHRPSSSSSSSSAPATTDAWGWGVAGMPAARALLSCCQFHRAEFWPTCSFWTWQRGAGSDSCDLR